jgi:deoxyribodipyrimidine photo-lyase
MQVNNAKISKPINIVWLRRNLRFDDNRPLVLAMKEDLPILLLFIFDSDILSKLELSDDLRVNFIHQQLKSLNSQLNKVKSSMLVMHGEVVPIFDKLLNQWPIQKIFHAEDFEPYAIERDLEVKQLAQSKNIQVRTCVDHLIYHPSHTLKQDLTPYQVYTPFSKAWLNNLKPEHTRSYDVDLKKVNWLQMKFDQVTLDEIGFEYKERTYPPAQIESNTIEEYGSLRNYPAEKASSRLGIHLRFGTISIRKIVTQALASADPTFLKQLIWREFFTQIMYHYPSSMNAAFKPKYRDLPWKYDEDHLAKWQAGKTGIPLVDAGMRELNETGTMHNRVRMITASWLTKNLLFDWRIGERYFASRLLDFELASNVGSWQWVAGTGCDAAPYFRIFNPFTQAQKFDPKGSYIKKWIPEIDSLDYPTPMVDYKTSREKCLAFFKKYAR